jgi:ankyrin repeat protein
LHYAVLGGNARVVEILTGQGADAKAENNEGVAPLLNALGLGHVRMAKVLIAAGARRVDVKAYHRKSYGTMIHETVPLLHEALNADSWIGRYARSGGSDSNEGPIRREWIELLFANGADPNERDGGGDTALHSAILLGDDESVRLFIAHGADVNARNKSNVTPLHCAAKDNRAELASLLLVKGADVNARDNGGETPLHTAALRGHREVIEVLLAHGADVNAKNARGRTPADEAARRGHKDIVSLLTTKATYLHEQ